VLGAFISSAIPDYHAAEDILQRCAIVLIRKFDRYDRSQSFVAWAIGIARYEVLAAKRNFGGDRLIFDGTALTRIASAYERIGPELGPVGHALERCVEQAGPKARKLLNLRYAADLKPREIAARLGASVNSTTVALNRIRGSLRECIEKRLAATSPREGFAQ
jgi:RNA polymerase sigma-70 factor (ECF subfamily)